MSRPTEIFEQHRPELFRLAYGMLGRVAPAEDAVQETFLRWQKQNTEEIHSPKAWLSKVVNRICLDEIKSAKNRREQYVGTDLPEPFLAGRSKSPEEALELAESLSMALLVVLDTLTPVQRAVFLLHEVFDYDYASISAIIDRSEANCRKIAQRARNLVREKRPGFDKNNTEQDRLVQTFAEAVKNRDMAQIERLLAEEAILYSDGGGKVNAARKPIIGAGKIAKFMVGIQKGATQPYHIEFREVNGEPGMMMLVEGQLQNVWSFHIEGGKIKGIYVVLNPDKLEHLRNRY
ncbi:RNA polymerase sigma-70 factor [Negadavirga shengliensis]|uniref:RNA polymerase sigma-70 factor n=1 Tax=Negadavirga shengliensis TaxID=1389218 RepID=A0ABV9T7N2_9BACT